MPHWRTLKKPGECYYTAGCRRPAREGKHYCWHHQAMTTRQQNAARQLRRQLGLCIFCLERAAPGFRRCPAHLGDSKKDNATRRTKRVKARGWRMVRVSV